MLWHASVVRSISFVIVSFKLTAFTAYQNAAISSRKCVNYTPFLRLYLKGCRTIVCVRAQAASQSTLQIRVRDEPLAEGDGNIEVLIDGFDSLASIVWNEASIQDN